MINMWKESDDAELIREASDGRIAGVTARLEFWMTDIPRGTNVNNHWSGLANFREAVKAIDWDAMYLTLYKFTSQTIHTSDFGAHVTATDDDDVIFEIAPQVEGLKTPTYAARELLWHLAARIDERLGLGFSETLAPHQLTQEHVATAEAQR